MNGNWYAWKMGELDRRYKDWGYGTMTCGDKKLPLVGDKHEFWQFCKCYPEGWTEDVPDERDDTEDDDVDAGDKVNE